MSLSLPSLVVLTPSRGLIHSRTVEAIHAAVACAIGSGVVRLVDPVGWWLVTHDLPIPDAHETLAARGLAAGADLLWFVEEDMLPPAHALRSLLARIWVHEGVGIEPRVVTCDYPVGERPTHSCVTRLPATGAVLWAGLGCTLMTRGALERLPRPWFRSDRQYLLGRTDKPELLMVNRPARYGGHDVAFYRACAELGMPVAVVPPDELLCGHARLRSLGQAQTNQGAHTIDVLTQIEVRH